MDLVVEVSTKYDRCLGYKWSDSVYTLNWCQFSLIGFHLLVDVALVTGFVCESLVFVNSCLFCSEKCGKLFLRCFELCSML